MIQNQDNNIQVMIYDVSNDTGHCAVDYRRRV